MVSASFNCCALKCFLTDVKRVVADVEPMTVASGSDWLRESGIMCLASFLISSDAVRDDLEAFPADIEFDSGCDGCELGDGGTSIDSWATRLSLEASTFSLALPDFLSLEREDLDGLETPLAWARVSWA
jgi:hypothetical protein